MMTNNNDETRDEKAARKKASDEFHITRSKALNTYAQLEQHMAILFDALLLGAQSMDSFAVFGAIVNTRSRLLLLDQLFQQRHGFGDFKKFFDGLLKEIQKIDTFRHKLVHWIILESSTGGRPFNPERDIFLAEHPNIFTKRKIYSLDIERFRHKTEFFSLLIYYFSLFAKTQHDFDGDPAKTPWTEIFQQRPTYPPPVGHQLDRYHKAP